MAAGKLGDYTQRVQARRLGHGRDTVFEVVVSDPIAWSLVGAWLELEPGGALMPSPQPSRRVVRGRRRRAGLVGHGLGHRHRPSRWPVARLGHRRRVRRAGLHGRLRAEDLERPHRREQDRRAARGQRPQCRRRGLGGVAGRVWAVDLVGPDAARREPRHGRAGRRDCGQARVSVGRPVGRPRDGRAGLAADGGRRAGRAAARRLPRRLDRERRAAHGRRLPGAQPDDPAVCVADTEPAAASGRRRWLVGALPGRERPARPASGHLDVGLRARAAREPDVPARPGADDGHVHARRLVDHRGRGAGRHRGQPT